MNWIEKIIRKSKHRSGLQLEDYEIVYPKEASKAIQAEIDKRCISRKELMDISEIKKKYDELLGWILDEIFDGCDIDGGSLQDTLEKLGLIVEVKLSKEEIENNPQYERCIEYDTDTLFFPYWSEEAKRADIKKAIEK